MNKIILGVNEFIDNTNASINCVFSNNNFSNVDKLNIDVMEDADLEINYDFTAMKKMEVTINVKKSVKLNVYEVISGESTKINIKYYLEEEAVVNIYKFNDINTIKEYVIIYLNGIGASVNYNLKTIAKNLEKYDILIYHNASDTNSKINNSGVNKSGTININVSSFVKKGYKNCNINQNNRIINLTNNECIIKPNLYIDEADVSANHSALIGNFSKEELFYLMSRGINKDESIKLLIKGFLTSNLTGTDEWINNILNILLKYWR